MIPEIDQHRDEIISLCEEFGVERLEVFGSAAVGDFDPGRSDIDFSTVYPDGFDFGSWGERANEIQQRLEQVIGRDVDLLTLRWVRNPYLRRSIETTRVPIYAR